MAELPKIPEITDLTDDQWITYNSHPASGIRYQESTAGTQTAARVTQDGHEIVSPNADLDAVYRQFMGRVSQWVDEDHVAGCTGTSPSGYPCQQCYPDGN